MNLFEFLAILSKEKFPFNIEYVEWSSSIKITVDTFSKMEVFEFDKDGITRQSIYIEADRTEDKPSIFENIFNLQDRPRKTWQTAAEDLGITFICPYIFAGINGNEYEAIGLLPDFGDGKGVLITSRHTDEEVDLMAELTNDFMLTGLSPKYYDLYNREHIIETLSEWGWIGGVNKPKWLIENL